MSAAQLADFLVPHVERQGGVLTMPDVYCLFNRARGSELVSPTDVIKARECGRMVSAQCMRVLIDSSAAHPFAGMSTVVRQPEGVVASSSL